MERRYGDVSSLCDWVEWWEGDDFAPRKNEGGDGSIKVGGKCLFLWTVANNWLSMLSVVALTIIYIPWAKLILFISLVHICDNRLLQRDAIIHNRKKSGEEDIIVVVGVPAPDVEVGIPVVNV